MSDRLYLGSLSLAALAMIAVALVFPQGLGARSPGPLGHEPPKPVTAHGPAEAPSLIPGLPAAPSSSQ